MFRRVCCMFSRRRRQCYTTCLLLLLFVLTASCLWLLQLRNDAAEFGPTSKPIYEHMAAVCSRELTVPQGSLLMGYARHTNILPARYSCVVRLRAPRQGQRLQLSVRHLNVRGSLHCQDAMLTVRQEEVVEVEIEEDVEEEEEGRNDGGGRKEGQQHQQHQRQEQRQQNSLTRRWEMCGREGPTGVYRTGRAGRVLVVELMSRAPSWADFQLVISPVTYIQHGSSPCPGDEAESFQCRAEDVCVPRHLMCNGQDDCGDHSDEGLLLCALSSTLLAVFVSVIAFIIIVCGVLSVLC